MKTELVISSIVLLFFLMRQVTVVFHEFGHALPLLLFADGDVTIFLGTMGDDPRAKRFKLGRLYVVWKFSLMNGGLCSHGGGIPRWLSIVTVMMGAVFTLVVGVIAAVVIFWVDAHGALKMLAVIFAASTVIDLFQNLVPRNDKVTLNDGSYIYNDGKILWYLLTQKKPNPPVDFALTQNEHGAYDPEQFDEALLKYDAARFAYGFYQCAVYANLENGRFEKALEMHVLLGKDFAYTASDYCNAGLANAALGRYEDAHKMYDKGLALDAASIYCLENKAYCYYMQANYAAAQQSASQAIINDSEFAPAYITHALALVKLNLTDTAREDVNTALELRPGYSYAYFPLALIEINQGNKTTALEFLELAAPHQHFIFDYQSTLAEANALPELVL